MEDTSAGESFRIHCSRLTWTTTKFNLRFASFLKCVPFEFVPNKNGILQSFPKSSWKRHVWVAVTIVLCAYAVFEVRSWR